MECSYRINDNSKSVSLLIDENERLRYNVASLKSPVSLKKHLIAKRINLDPQQNWHNVRLVKTEPQQTKNKLNQNSALRVAAKAFIDLFTPKREAVAQE